MSHLLKVHIVFCFMCMMFCLHASAHTTHAVPMEARRELHPLELEWQMVVSLYVGAENWILVLWKSTQYVLRRHISILPKWTWPSCHTSSHAELCSCLEQWWVFSRMHEQWLSYWLTFRLSLLCSDYPWVPSSVLVIGTFSFVLYFFSMGSPEASTKCRCNTLIREIFLRWKAGGWGEFM